MARLAEAGCERGSAATAGQPPPIVLDLDTGVWAGVPCWTGRAERWVRFTVPIAYDLRYDAAVRPVFGVNQVSRAAVLAVAAARAVYAEHATGRHCRPTNERLAADTGLSVRTVQRADAALRLLGVATEVLRGRQRTRTERLASWRVGDRGRGWASVWALHDDAVLARAIRALSPHPGGSLFRNPISCSSELTTGSRRPAGAGGRGARRRASPDPGGGRLAARWRADPGAPP
ncbi:MAG: helix-turn-helix domain-containing protein, partial [Mycobacterium sp.]